MFPHSCSSEQTLLWLIWKRALPQFSTSFCSFQNYELPLVWAERMKYRSLIWSWVYPSETILGRSLWRNAMLRLISELVPHYVQCILIFCMAMERYFLICHAAAVSQILNKKRRILCYNLIVALLIFVTGSVFYLMRNGFKDHWYDDSVPHLTPQ